MLIQVFYEFTVFFIFVGVVPIYRNITTRKGVTPMSTALCTLCNLHHLYVTYYTFFKGAYRK